MTAIAFVDVERGWAVGTEGTIVYTDNGGLSWSPQASGVGVNLYDVYFLDRYHGWAVGAGGALLRYH